MKSASFLSSLIMFVGEAVQHDQYHQNVVQAVRASVVHVESSESDHRVVSF